MKKILLLILSFLLITKVYAYENELFKIDIPDGYKEQINDNTYLFTKDNTYISLIISKNTNNYDVNKFNEKDIEKQKDYIINSYKNELNNYKTIPTVSNMILIDDNNISYLEYDLSFDSKKEIGHNIYQKTRMYTTDNYIYSITISSDTQIKDSEINVLDSLQIKDTYLKNINIYIYIIFSIIIIIILIIIVNHKKRHK